MPAQLKQGLIIDNRYKILSTLGRGGMGTVYLAMEVGLERLVALKFLHAEHLSDSDSFARFKREGRALSLLKHENIISIYRCGLWEQSPYIAMEFVKGTTLRQIIHDQQLPTKDIIPLALQICSGLEAAHKCGITHRDLKPDNIILIQEDDCLLQVKLLDFGLATINHSNTQHLTQTGELIGSVYYMSPEQCKGARTDSRSDVYAVGCILYELLTGSPPFDCDNPIGLIHKHVNEQPAKLAQTTPSGLDKVVHKALQKNPSLRHQSMSELSTELRIVQDGNGASLALNNDGRWPPRRRKFGYLTIVSIAIVVLPALLYCKLRRGEFNVAQPAPPVRSLNARALKSQYSQLFFVPQSEKSAVTQKIVEELETYDDGSLSVWEKIDLYGRLSDSQLCTTSETTTHLEKLMRCEELTYNLDAQAEVLILRANHKQSIGNFKDAEKDLTRAVNLTFKTGNHDRHAESLSRLANLYLDNNQASLAEQAAVRAKNAWKTVDRSLRVSTIALLLRAQLSAGKKATAKQTAAELLTLLRNDPASVAVCIRLCDELRILSPTLALEQANQFIGFFEKSKFSVSPLITPLLIRRADLTIAAGRVQESVNLYQNLLNTRCKGTNTHANLDNRLGCMIGLGRAYTRLGLFDNSNEMLLKGLRETKPDSIPRFDFLLELVHLACLRNNKTQFTYYLNEIDKISLATFRSEGRAFLQYTNLAKCVKDTPIREASSDILSHFTNRLLKTSGVSPDLLKQVYQRYAESLNDQGNTARSIEIYQHLLQSSPDDDRALDGARLKLAEIYRQRKEYSKAEPLLRNTILNTANSLLKLQASSLLMSTMLEAGKPDEALQFISTVPPPGKLVSEGSPRVMSFYQIELAKAYAYYLKGNRRKYKEHLAKAAPMARFLHLMVLEKLDCDK